MADWALTVRARWLEWRTARRCRHHADQLHHTRESEVMGRGAVLFTAICLAPSVVVQLTSGDASHVVIQWGGMWLSTLWALSLGFGVIAVWVARFLRAADVAALVECIGMIWMSSASISFAVSLVGSDRTAGSTFVLGLASASAGNMVVGRVRLLTRQWLLARKVAKGLT